MPQGIFKGCRGMAGSVLDTRGRGMYAAMSMNDEAYQVATPLFRALELGEAEKVKALLAAGADPNESQGEDEDAALLVAALKGRADIAGLLLEAGAKADYGDAYGYTPLMGAVCAHNLPLAKLLLGAGADVHKVCARSGATALHDAAAGGHLEIASALLEAGADPNAPENKEGLTALMCAVRSLAPEMVQLLLRHGADAGHVASRGDTVLDFARNTLEFIWEPNKRSKAQRIIDILAHAAD